MKPKVLTKFEPRLQPPLSKRDFFWRQIKFIGFGFCILGCSLLLGVFGYHYFAELTWLDALVNASMILTGMGPVDRVSSVSGKLFSSFYAIFSGVAFLSFVATLFAPVFHRFLHKFHWDT